MYTGAVKTDATKTVQIKRNNDLCSFQLHFIIDFVLTERKLAHGPVEFPARLISHFVMNIIMAKKPPEFPAIRYFSDCIYFSADPHPVYSFGFMHMYFSI